MKQFINKSKAITLIVMIVLTAQTGKAELRTPTRFTESGNPFV